MDEIQVMNTAHEAYGHAYFYDLKQQGQDVNVNHKYATELDKDGQCCMFVPSNHALENQILKVTNQARFNYQSQKEMKRMISFIIVMHLFFSSIQGQNLIDSLKTDTIELHQCLIIVKYPALYNKKESSLEYGGRGISFASQPPISIITVTESANSKIDFGDNCIINGKFDLEDRYTEKGICQLKGYFRSDYYKGTHIIISYANVSECEHTLFEYILDSVSIKWVSIPIEDLIPVQKHRCYV